MKNPAELSSLDKIVILDDFSDRIYYEIYLSIVDFYITGKIPSYQDIKFQFKDDDLVKEIIEFVEEDLTAPDNLHIVYEELCEVSRKRRLEQTGQYLQKSVKSKQKSQDIIRQVESSLLQITVNNGINIDTVASIEGEYLKELKTKIDRYRKTNSIRGVIDLPTGFDILDMYTLGFQKSTTWILGGSTSDGKTQMAVQMCNAAILADNQVLFFMLEDDKRKLLTRFIALKSGVPIMKLMCGNITDAEYDKAKQASAQLKQADRLLIEDETFDINDIVTKTQFAKLKYPNLSFIIIDHINLITDKLIREGNREREIGMASKKLVALAKRLEISILILQQLNTNPDDRKKGLPVTTNDLRDCKSTSHDSSVTILLHCPDKFNQDAQFSRKHTQLVLAKNRYGEVNKILDFTSRANIGKFIEGVPNVKPV